eukprot:Phypoly_transcript_00781.p1 GENE.Phypoly_transcript_00781~~Phypoly_transcript_00781.p1  ORF type:complete len:951 (+),score=205.22 Phypoly_transcript_00781:154-3006(+)
MNPQVFCGLLPNTSICVDCFKQHPNVSVYFLSHFHADHYQGLSSHWRGGTIYCTDITRSLLLHKFKLLPTSVVAIEVMTPLCLRLSGSETMNATAFPANHCPGSVMFFFEGSFGKYLYTGDFRYTPLMNALPLPRGEIDRLFLDTTFCVPYWIFPTKEDSIQQIVKLINSHSATCKVFLECTMLGAEVVLASVAQEFGTSIFVEKGKFEELSLIPELAQCLTSDPTATRFHACAHMTFSASSAARHAALSYVASHQFKAKARRNALARSGSGEGGVNGGEKEVLCIKPSVQWFRAQGAAAPAKYFNQPAKVDGIWHVMFSIHSSFPELVTFVNQLAPKTVTPITTIDRTGFQKLVELTHTNVLYLNDKNIKQNFIANKNMKQNIIASKNTYKNANNHNNITNSINNDKTNDNNINENKGNNIKSNTNNNANNKNNAINENEDEINGEGNRIPAPPPLPRPKKPKIELIMSQGFADAMFNAPDTQEEEKRDAHKAKPPPSPSLSPPPSPPFASFPSYPPSPSLSPPSSPPSSLPSQRTNIVKSEQTKEEEQETLSPVFRLHYRSDSEDEAEIIETPKSQKLTQTATRKSIFTTHMQDLPTQDENYDSAKNDHPNTFQELETQDIDNILPSTTKTIFPPFNTHSFIAPTNENSIQELETQDIDMHVTSKATNFPQEPVDNYTQKSAAQDTDNLDGIIPMLFPKTANLSQGSETRHSKKSATPDTNLEQSADSPPIYFAESNGDSLDLDLDPDRTPEILPFSDDDDTPPIWDPVKNLQPESVLNEPQRGSLVPQPEDAYVLSDREQSDSDFLKNLLQIPVLIRTEETRTHQPTHSPDSTTAQTPAKPPPPPSSPIANLQPTQVLSRPEEPRPTPADERERQILLEELAKKCNWDSDLDLLDDDESPEPSNSQKEREKGDEADGDADGDTDEKGAEDVWSQTKKRKFKFSFPVI